MPPVAANPTMQPDGQTAYMASPFWGRLLHRPPFVFAKGENSTLFFIFCLLSFILKKTTGKQEAFPWFFA